MPNNISLHSKRIACALRKGTSVILVQVNKDFPKQLVALVQKVTRPWGHFQSVVGMQPQGFRTEDTAMVSWSCCGLRCSVHQCRYLGGVKQKKIKPKTRIKMSHALLLKACRLAKLSFDLVRRDFADFIE